MKSQHYCNANPQGPLQCTTFTSPQSLKMTLIFSFIPLLLICQWWVTYFLVIFSSGLQGKFRITTSSQNSTHIFYFKIFSFVEQTHVTLHAYDKLEMVSIKNIIYIWKIMHHPFFMNTRISSFFVIYSKVIPKKLWKWKK
jgi:hypothetical protein